MNLIKFKTVLIAIFYILLYTAIYIYIVTLDILKISQNISKLHAISQSWTRWLLLPLTSGTYLRGVFPQTSSLTHWQILHLPKTLDKAGKAAMLGNQFDLKRLSAQIAGSIESITPRHKRWVRANLTWGRRQRETEFPSLSWHTSNGEHGKGEPSGGPRGHATCIDMRHAAVSSAKLWREECASCFVKLSNAADESSTRDGARAVYGIA